MATRGRIGALASALAAVALACCGGGTIGSPDADADADADAPPDAGVDPCEDIACPPGQRCVLGICRVVELCADVLCPNPGQVCDSRTGGCVPSDQDDDGDGFTVGAGDCDDGDPAVNPGATERCNGVDDDCNGVVDDGLEPRLCTTACGSGPESCVAGSWTCSVPTECECPAGERDSESCGRCGTRSRLCQDDYRWSSWDECVGEGACSPGDTRSCTACSQTGSQTCSRSCAWGECVISGCCTDGDCADEQRCFGGRCSSFCHRNDGSVTCATLCGWAGMTCTGAIVYGTGERTTCGVSGIRMDCYGV